MKHKYTFALGTAALLGLAVLGSMPVSVLPAMAQAVICSNRPTGDSTNSCANTRFVTAAVAGFLPTALTSGHLFVGNGSNIATDVALSGDCTLANTGAITCTKTSGTSFGTLATTTPIAAGVTTALGIAPNAAGGFVTQGTTQISFTVASGAKVLGTTAISSAACATAQTDTATGVASTDAVTVNFNADPTSSTGYTPVTTGMLTIFVYPTSNNVNFRVCNITAATITPQAVTINWRVVR